MAHRYRDFLRHCQTIKDRQTRRAAQKFARDTVEALANALAERASGIINRSGVVVCGCTIEPEAPPSALLDRQFTLAESDKRPPDRLKAAVERWLDELDDWLRGACRRIDTAGQRDQAARCRNVRMGIVASAGLILVVLLLAFVIHPKQKTCLPADKKDEANTPPTRVDYQRSEHVEHPPAIATAKPAGAQPPPAHPVKNAPPGVSAAPAKPVPASTPASQFPTAKARIVERETYAVAKLGTCIVEREISGPFTARGAPADRCQVHAAASGEAPTTTPCPAPSQGNRLPQSPGGCAGDACTSGPLLTQCPEKFTQAVEKADKAKAEEEAKAKANQDAEKPPSWCAVTDKKSALYLPYQIFLVTLNALIALLIAQIGLALVRHLRIEWYPFTPAKPEKSEDGGGKPEIGQRVASATQQLLQHQALIVAATLYGTAHFAQPGPSTADARLTGLEQATYKTAEVVVANTQAIGQLAGVVNETSKQFVGLGGAIAGSVNDLHAAGKKNAELLGSTVEGHTRAVAALNQSGEGLGKGIVQVGKSLTDMGISLGKFSEHVDLRLREAESVGKRTVSVGEQNLDVPQKTQQGDRVVREALRDQVANRRALDVLWVESTFDVPGMNWLWDVFGLPRPICNYFGTIRPRHDRWDVACRRASAKSPPEAQPHDTTSSGLRESSAGASPTETTQLSQPEPDTATPVSRSAP